MVEKQAAYLTLGLTPSFEKKSTNFSAFYRTHYFRPRLHGYVLKSFRFHFVAFSNQSTLVCVFKCLRFHDRFQSLK